MKRFISFFMVLTLLVLCAVSFSACGEGEVADDESSADGSVASEETQVVATDAVLPDVKGKTEAEAKAELETAGFEVLTAYCYSDVAKDTVVAQSKVVGEAYDLGTQIVIQVSNGLTAQESALVEMRDPLVDSREVLAVGANADYEPLNYENMKGIWISQLDLIPVYKDVDTGIQRDEAEFTALIKQIYKNVADAGFNTVIVQLHPDCDSMYPSENFPWSDYLFSGYGNTSIYDLLPILIDEAHALDLSFQAWINPMRACLETEMEFVNVRYPIKQWYLDEEKKSTYLFTDNKRLYLNPAYEEVRNYVVSVAQEICRYYDVDGIHMDDYFYPSNNPNYDKAAFEAQGEHRLLKNFRINNVNTLVKQLYDAVKAENPKMLFGISPAGEIDNNLNNLSADVKTWCQKEGYIDYICPQIYFGWQHGSVPFDKLSERWFEMKTCDSVQMILGTTLHKVGKSDTWAGAGKEEWVENSDVLKKSFEYINSNLDKVDGFAIFSYQYIWDAITGERVDYTKAEVDGFMPVMQGLKWE